MYGLNVMIGGPYRPILILFILVVTGFTFVRESMPVHDMGKLGCFIDVRGFRLGTQLQRYVRIIRLHCTNGAILVKLYRGRYFS